MGLEHHWILVYAGTPETSVLWILRDGCLYLDVISLSVLAFVTCVISKTSLPRPMSRMFSPVFSSRCSMVSSLTFTSLIHFELIFVNGIR